MAIELNNFDEKLKEAFSDFEAKPPSSIWYGIAERLPQKALARGIFPVSLRVAASVAVLLVGSLTFWYFQTRPVAQTQIIALQPIVAQANQIIASNPVELPIPVSTQTPVYPAGGRVISLQPKEDFAKSELTFETGSSLNPIPSLLASVVNKRPGLATKSANIYLPPPPVELAAVSFEPVEKTADYPLFAIGLQVGPQYSYRRLSELSLSSFAGIPFESLENHLISYSAGLTLNIQLSRRAGIRTGLNYSVSGQFINDVFAFSNRDNSPIFELPANQKFGHPQTIITSQGYIRLNEPSLFFSDAQSYRVLTNKQFLADGEPSNLMMRDFGISQYFSFVEVPLMAYYKLLNMRQAELQLKAGGSINYLLENAVFLGKNSMQSAIGDTYGLKKFNMSVLGGVVLNVPLGQKLNLTFEPTAQLFMLPMVRNNLMIGRALPFQYSFFTGITYGF